jgi:hypothetical protein
MQIFETCQHEQLVPSRSHKTKHIVHQSNNIMSANGTPLAFQFDTFPTALQNAVGQGGGGGEVGCEIGKALCLGEAKAKGTVPATKQ